MQTFTSAISAGFKWLLIPVIILITGVFAHAQELSNWLIWNAEKGQYEAAKLADRDAVYYLIWDASKSPGKQMRIWAEESFSVWINHGLYRSAIQSVELNADSVMGALDGPVVLGFYASKGWKNGFPLEVALNYPSLMKSLPESSPLFRDRVMLDQFVSVALIIWLCLVAFMRVNHPKVFSEYFNPAAVFFRRINQDSLIMARQLNPATVFVTYLVAFHLMFAFILFVNLHPQPPAVLNFLVSGRMEILLLTLIIGSLVVYALYFLKYILVYLLCSMFGFKSFSQIHFFDFLRITNMIYIGFILAGFVALWWGNPDDDLILNRLFIAFFGLLMLRILILFFKLVFNTHLQFSYLFSYLCTTEIIPLAIGLNMVLNG
jgi:hypothetical protein